MAGKKNNFEWNHLSKLSYVRTIADDPDETVAGVSEIIDLSGSDQGHTNIIKVALMQEALAAANFWNINSMTVSLWGEVLASSNLNTSPTPPAGIFTWAEVDSKSVANVSGSFVIRFTDLPALRYKIVIPVAHFADAAKHVYIFEAHTS